MRCKEIECDLEELKNIIENDEDTIRFLTYDMIEVLEEMLYYTALIYIYICFKLGVKYQELGFNNTGKSALELSKSFYLKGVKGWFFLEGLDQDMQESLHRVFELFLPTFFKKITNIFQKITNFLQKITNLFQKITNFFQKITNIFQRWTNFRCKLGRTHHL